jgi:hypothetical protein
VEKMFFLCSPQPLVPNVLYLFLPGFLAMIYPFFSGYFIRKSLDLLRKGAIREDIYRNLLKEEKWSLGFLGLLGLIDYVPVEKYSYLMCLAILFPFVILLLAFPIYFTFNFIFFLLNKERYNNEERKLLLSFYGFPTFFIIIVGFIYKFLFHAASFETPLGIYYYFLDEGKYWFIGIFIFLIVIFLIFYTIKSIKKEEATV